MPKLQVKWTEEGGDAATIGLNGVSLVSGTPITSNAFSLEGYNQMAVYVNLTRNASTAHTFYLEYSNDDGTTWFRAQASSVAAGTETLSDHTVSKTVSTSDTYVHLFGNIFGTLGRLVFDSTAGDADDTVVVNLMFGVSV